jgi:hypothetical protein
MSIDSDEAPQKPRTSLGCVIAVAVLILLFLAILFPAVLAVREAGRGISCAGNFKFFGLAALNYESSRGRLPPAYLTDRDGQPAHSWRAMVLPYLNPPLYNSTVLGYRR